jgi:hypothetical protein
MFLSLKCRGLSNTLYLLRSPGYIKFLRFRHLVLDIHLCVENISVSNPAHSIYNSFGSSQLTIQRFLSVLMV